MRKLTWKIARLKAKYGFNPRRLWMRYLLGASIIFALMFVSHQSSLKAISTGKDDAYFIKLSGQQTIVSQQLHLTVNQYRIRPTKELHSELERLLASFARTHQILVESVYVSPELSALYFGNGEGQGLAADSMTFMNELAVFIGKEMSSPEAQEAYHFINEFVPSTLLEKLKSSVVLQKVKADANFKDLKSLLDKTLLALGVILLLEFIFIYMPGQRSVVRAIDRLEKHRSNLRRSRKALEKKNSELNNSYNQMEHAAFHDALTGLANRRYLEQELSERIVKYAKLDGSMAALHIDLDNFKTINDTLGHKAGDHLLEHAAKLFKTHARATDFVSRIGGDEFVILTDEHINEERAARIAQRLINAFAKPVPFEGKDLKVSASIGIDLFNPKDKLGDNSVSDILSQADVALYLAKERGRNCYEFFNYDQYQKYLENLVTEGKAINEKK